jgi:undecaprenol kinase
MNTAIERVVDLVTAEYHPLAKQAKDIAAGAVFVYAILSVIVGIIIFLPYVLKQF